MTDRLKSRFTCHKSWWKFSVKRISCKTKQLVEYFSFLRFFWLCFFFKIHIAQESLFTKKKFPSKLDLIERIAKAWLFFFCLIKKPLVACFPCVLLYGRIVLMLFSSNVSYYPKCHNLVVVLLLVHFHPRFKIHEIVCTCCIS